MQSSCGSPDSLSPFKHPAGSERVAVSLRDVRRHPGDRPIGNLRRERPHSDGPASASAAYRSGLWSSDPAHRDSSTAATGLTLAANLSSAPRPLRPLLPRPSSETREELSWVQSGHTGSHEPPRKKSKAAPKRRKPLESENTPTVIYERRSAAQKRRREREAREREDGPIQLQSDTVHPKRSASQRARRQRELAAQIHANLHVPEFSRERTENKRSIAQSLRRKVDKANRLLDRDPDCDPTGALTDALWAEHDANNARRENRIESRSAWMRRTHGGMSIPQWDSQLSLS